ncbi:hypothetical protein FA95DRAFT_1601907 [Auriscalpium vulgare]|uniref:Uncharacterized protein n=1 Tax=Auriscalpium vulgare TaxID=40419 RepID=A0ACB8S817_9AGAM|nr:hypothetical protein FA95DRAFT_1601907 [Auriscalpium vulgare]
MASTLHTPVARRLRRVKHILIVCSGKGGFGKASVSRCRCTRPRRTRVSGSSTSISRGCRSRGCSASTEPEQRRVGAGDDAVVWRGPKKNAMIRQVLGDVRWGELDYLVIDTPLGTSDEHLSLLEHMAPVLSAVIVTTSR